MGKRLWGVILFLLASALGAEAQYFAVNGACSLGGQATVMQGMASSGTKPLRGGNTYNGTGVMASYPGCTVTVYQTGTLVPAPIYLTASGSAQSNPFTGNLTDGSWVFFASAGCYDVMISSGATQASTMPNSKTFPGMCAGTGTGGGGGGTNGTSVTVNGTAAVPNQLNFTNTLLVPGGSSVVNFLLNGNTVGAYVTGGGGGGGSLPTTPQYDLFASSGAGAAQVSGVKGGAGFLQGQVITATGDVTSSPSPFPALPNASVEYFPQGAVFGGITVGATNGLAAYFSHSASSGAGPGYHNGGVMLGGGNSSGTNYQVYLDCESSPSLGCDFKVPITQNGSAIGGGGGGTPLPTIPQWNLFASSGVGTATDSGVAAETGFLRAQVIEASGAAGAAPSGFTPPNGSIEYFPTGATYGGLNVGTLNGIAIHFSHSSRATGAPGNGGVALAGGNATGTASTYQIYVDCEQVGCDFKVPVTYLGNGIGGGGGTITGATTGGGLVVSGTTLGMLTTCTANQYLSWSGSAWVCTTLPASGGVTSINTVAGAFTFSGAGVSCSGTTCTFTGGGGGSGTVSSGTGGHFTWYSTTGTTVSSNANLDDSLTTAATITSQETIAAPGINVNGTGGIAMTGAGGTLPTVSSGSGGLGIGPGGIPQYNANGAGWLNIGSGGAAGVSSINGSTGAFTFTGANVNCATTTCTFSVPNPILSTAGTTLPAPVAGQGAIGIATGGVPQISVNGGAWTAIPTTAGGGSGTVSPNPTTAGALAYYPTAANSTTVSPIAAGVISSTGFGIGVGPSGVYQLGSFTAPDVSLARGAANLLLLTTGGSSGENAYLRSYNSCAVGAPVAFSSSIGQICIRILPAVTRAWIVHCVIPWGFTAGTGSAVVTFSLSLNQAPTATSYFTNVLWASTGTAPVSGTSLIPTTAGNTPVLTTAALDSTLTSTVFSLVLDGVVNASSTATTFSIAATTSGGTGVAAEMKSGAYCRVE